MKLAQDVCKNLEKVTKDKETLGIVQQYDKTVQMAVFPHDIGHGPFCHVVDEAMKRCFNISHETMPKMIIQSQLKGEIESQDISVEDATKLGEQSLEG